MSGFRLRHLGESLRPRAADLVLAALVVGVTVMLVAPLRPWIVDLLVGANFCFAVLILCHALLAERPLSFSAFPTIILVATLYRLALNVASTRLILLEADAGRIIGAFGGLLVGGDLLVGAIVFGILALVLFLVITRGAERVAEVAARFTLDALPGAQLAIDADLRQGGISPAEAEARRGALEARSHYFGALDGAMKFVRGDAVVALAIIFVNSLGGVAVGVLRRGLGFSEALELYGRLTVGDGLVTLVPALFVSTAAGLLVTRVGQGTGRIRLGRAMARQLFGDPYALLATAGAMTVLAVIPGLPAWPFALAALGLGVVGLRALVRRPADPAADDEPGPARAASPVRLELAPALHAALIARRPGDGVNGEPAAHLALPLLALGLPVSRIALGAAPDLGEDQVRLVVRGVPAETRRVTSPDPLPELRDLVARHAATALGIEETAHLVRDLTASHPALLRQTVPRVIDLPRLADLGRAMLEDGLSLDLLPEALEAAARRPAGAPLDELLQETRQRLGGVISADLAPADGPLAIWILDRELERVLVNSLFATAGFSRLVLDRDLSSDLVARARRTVGDDPAPVLVVDPRLRRPLARLLATTGLRVVAAGELVPDLETRIAGTLAAG